MKNKTSKIAQARAAELATAIAAREAATAAERAGVAKLNFKKSKKAYKQARRAAKRAAKKAKEAQKKFAPLAEYLKRAKAKTTRKPPAKRS
jgi:hypothetical protein